MGKNKQVYCKVCLRAMRSDKLKRHNKVHEKYEKNEYSSIHRSQESIQTTSTYCSEESEESSTLPRIDGEGLNFKNEKSRI